MEYIDIHGNIHQFINTTHILHINEENDIVKIIKFSKKLKTIIISNNNKLTTISSFPKTLKELHVINNENLESIYIPNIHEKFIIYNNPKLLNIDDLIDEYKSTTFYKSYYPDIITEEESDDESTFSIGLELNKEDLQIDDWIFTTNVEEYKSSPLFLHNDSKYLISNREYNGYVYPVITIPKGTILYTYGKGNNINLKDKYHNLYNLEEGTEFESQLKFFYPVPYAAKLGIDVDYNICNIVVTNHDIQILCLISPAPQSNETLRLCSENKVINEKFEDVNYYDNEFTIPCETYDHDLCINVKMMKDMNIQGYICISNDDSISNGETWYRNMDKESMKHYKAYIEEYIFNSCLSSIYKKNNNIDFINEKLKLNLPENIKHRMFGIPEIVLVPLKTEYFFSIDQEKILKAFHSIKNDEEFKNKDSEINNIFKNMFNYQVINICDLPDLKDYIEKIETNILTNKQCQTLQLFSDELVIKEISTHLRYEKLNFDDVNYTLSYLKQNEKNPFCAFETIGYHLLQGQHGGKRKTLRKRVKTLIRTRYFRKLKKTNLFTTTSRKVIKIKGGGHNNKIIFEKTRGGIPVVYTIPG